MLSALVARAAEESARKIVLTVPQILSFLSAFAFIHRVCCIESDGPRWHNEFITLSDLFGIHNVLIVALCLRL